MDTSKDSQPGNAEEMECYLTQDQNETLEWSAPGRIRNKMIVIDTIPIIHYFVNTKEDDEALKKTAPFRTIIR